MDIETKITRSKSYKIQIDPPAGQFFTNALASADLEVDFEANQDSAVSFIGAGNISSVQIVMNEEIPDTNSSYAASSSKTVLNDAKLKHLYKDLDVSPADISNLPAEGDAMFKAAIATKNWKDYSFTFSGSSSSTSNQTVADY